MQQRIASRSTSISMPRAASILRPATLNGSHSAVGRGYFLDRCRLDQEPVEEWTASTESCSTRPASSTRAHGHAASEIQLFRLRGRQRVLDQRGHGGQCGEVDLGWRVGLVLLVDH